MTPRAWNAIASVGAAVVTYGFARVVDAVVHSPRGEVLLVSDAVLATALSVGVYLWLNLRATQTQLTNLERAQIALDTQLSLAADIQRHLLPAMPARSDGVRWAARLEAALRIGGDFYDFIPSGTDTLFVVGDVSGKGIPAALLQASAHSLFRTLGREQTDPAELLTRISREIYAENAGGSYLTCVLVRFDTERRMLMYANAGHPPGLILGSSGRRLLSRGGPPVGLFPDTAYESETIAVDEGDLGVIVTDGVTEAFDEDGVAAVEILNRTICSIPEPRTPDRVCDTLMEMARRNHGPRGVANWQDDKTVLAFLLDGKGA